MNLLALETTGVHASVALIHHENEIWVRTSDRSMDHLKDLIPMTAALLAEAGVKKEELTHIAVSVGPGSFTGIRIGIATARTLGQALHLPVIPVPTLASFLCADPVFFRTEPSVRNGAQTDIRPAADGAKHDAAEPTESCVMKRIVPPEGLQAVTADLVCPMIDARRGNVYAAIYDAGKQRNFFAHSDEGREDARKAWEALTDPACIPVEQFLEQVLHCADRMRNQGEGDLESSPVERGSVRVVFYGNGVERYDGSFRTAMERAAEQGILLEPAPPARRSPHAVFIAGLGAFMKEAGVESSWKDVKPVYLRRTEAEQKLAAGLLGKKKADRKPEPVMEMPSPDEPVFCRLAGEPDIPALAALDAVCFSRAWSAQAFQGEICPQGSRTSIYVAAVNQKQELIGFAGMLCLLGEGEITRVAVHPLYRLRGIGDRMMELLLQEADRHGIGDVTLEVRESNRSAIALYKNHGFSVEARRDHYYSETGEHALILWRRTQNAAPGLSGNAEGSGQKKDAGHTGSAPDSETGRQSGLSDPVACAGLPGGSPAEPDAGKEEAAK